ncbi:helix-turn-helix domain-containing protein [Kitasatospora nipponensis]|uniref:helix-turn-helix domain-containing protein n=1 Tax=Kitasatospora nipponensis TaxID=258049 RepID=UPI0031D54FC2
MSGLVAERGRMPELHGLQVPQPHRLPFAIGSFESIGPLSLADYPHRHSFFEIVLVTGGTGRHVLDLVAHPVEPPRLGVIAPGQVHHWQDVRGITGWVILFNEDFLLGHPGDGEALRALGRRPWPLLDPVMAARFSSLAAELADEYLLGGEGCAEVLRAGLHILIVWAARLGAPASGVAASGGRAAELASAFARLVADPGRGERSVAGCARELGVSVAHLHEVVRRQVGRTPGRLIREQQTLEAKRLIAVTNLTISQVAAAIGFVDPAYFSRFFRRETGMTPGGYRREVREKHQDPRDPSIVAPGAPA